MGTLTSYGLDGRGSFPVRNKGFSSLHRVQTSSKAKPAFYSIGKNGLSSITGQPTSFGIPGVLDFVHRLEF
jgi:hypothetical protein